MQAFQGLKKASFGGFFFKNNAKLFRRGQKLPITFVMNTLSLALQPSGSVPEAIP